MKKEPITACLLTVIISLINSSCISSKYQQCRNLMEIANQTVEQTQKITNNKQTRNPQRALQAAEVMTNAGQQMGDLAIRDESLQQYQKQFMQLYHDQAQATRSFVEAYEKKDQRKLQQVQQQLQQLSASEEQLVTKINQYCLE